MQLLFDKKHNIDRSPI